MDKGGSHDELLARREALHLQHQTPFKQMEDDVAAINSRLDAMENRLDAMDSQLDAVKSELSIVSKFQARDCIHAGTEQLRIDVLSKLYALSSGDTRVTHEKIHEESRLLGPMANSLTARYLQEIGAGQLIPCLEFIRSDELRKERTIMAHQRSYKTFAHFVVKGAAKNENRCVGLKKDLEEAFVFAYGMTWEEAAEAAGL